MRDYKCYLPHHREFEEPEMMDRTSKVLILSLFVMLISLMAYSFVDGLVRTAEIEAALAQARKAERQRVYTAAADLLAGHEQYRKQLDHQIDLAYRQGR